MSLTQVHTTYGTTVLWRLVGALLAWLLLHALRGPLLLALHVVEVVMARIDVYATRQTARPPRPEPFPTAAPAA